MLRYTQVNFRAERERSGGKIYGEEYEICAVDDSRTVLSIRIFVFGRQPIERYSKVHNIFTHVWDVPYRKAEKKIHYICVIHNLSWLHWRWFHCKNCQNCGICLIIAGEKLKDGLSLGFLYGWYVSFHRLNLTYRKYTSFTFVFIFMSNHIFF